MAVLTSGVVLLSLSACGTGEPNNDDDERPLVVTTFSVLADITAQIAGEEHIAVRSITPVGAEVHEYDPTPSDVQAAADADLIIENGLGLEAWFEQFIAHSDAAVITASDGIDVRPVTRIPGHPSDVGGEGEMPTDPHAWISPQQAATYVDNIETALAQQFPEHAEEFADNADEYRQQLEEVAEDAQSRAAAAENEVFVVSCEGAFSYLAADLGLTEHYLWPLNAEDEGSPQQVEAQIEFVAENDVPVIFCESTVNPGPQEQVAGSTGAELGGTLYVDSISESGGTVPSYLELVEHNIDTILEPHE